MDDWKDYQKLVLHELERLNTHIDELFQAQQNNALDIASLKATSGIIATVASVITTMGMAVGELIYNSIHK